VLTGAKLEFRKLEPGPLNRKTVADPIDRGDKKGGRKAAFLLPLGLVRQ